MLYPKSTIKKVSVDIEQSTCIEGLKILKETINSMINEQIKKIEDNQELIVQVRYIPQCGKFMIEKGLKAEYVINGYFAKPELLEEIKCKRKDTKKYQVILEEIKKKYNPDVIKA